MRIIEKSVSVSVSVALLLISCAQGLVAAEIQIVKKDPKYGFTTASGRSPQLMYFATLEEAFSEVKARYATWDTNNVRHELSNLRGEPTGINYNGLPATYMWDVHRTIYGKSEFFTSREITRYGYCEQDSDPLEGETKWSLMQNGSSLWCERQIPVPINVSPIASTQNTCMAQEYSDSWGKYADGGMIGNPIVVPTGEKIQTELDYFDGGVGALGVERYFRSRWATDNLTKNYGQGRAWRHNHAAGFNQINDNVLRIDLPGGRERFFVRDTFGDGGNPGDWRSVNGLDVLIKNSGMWTLRLAESNSIYIFNNRGQLISVRYPNEWVVTYVYAGSLLTQVYDSFGRVIKYEYDDGGLLVRVVAPDNSAIQYSYDDGRRLQNVIYADQTSRTYHYEHSTYQNLLTGISVQGRRYSIFEYDAKAIAASTSLAGGADKYVVSYNGAPLSAMGATVVDPLGTARNYAFRAVKGIWAVTSANKYSPTGKVDAASRTQNNLGLIASMADFQGVVTNIQWDGARRLPQTVTEASNRPESRTIQTEWHSQWRLPVKVIESGRETSYTYDSAGNRTSQSIKDTVSGTTLTWAWTYHPSGLVATETAPNGAVTSYQYDSFGNLTRSINALGHVDTYTHDSGGRVLTHTAPSGSVASYTYDARGRMLSANQGGFVTTFTYHSSGQVATASLPHGHVITYNYDAAQRLVGWSDNRGNSGVYILDAMGNRTQEDIRNPEGQTVWRLARTINSLNRVQSITLGGQSTTFSYDGNGEMYAVTNGLGQSSSRTLDALRRVVTHANAEGYGASLTYNALDSVTQAKDFKGVATSYERDALGNARTEASADAGK